MPRERGITGAEMRSQIAWSEEYENQEEIAYQIRLSEIMLLVTSAVCVGTCSPASNLNRLRIARSWQVGVGSDVDRSHVV